MRARCAELAREQAPPRERWLLRGNYGGWYLWTNRSGDICYASVLNFWEAS